MERRKHNRKPIRLKALYQVEGGKPQEGFCRDIGHGGMFLECSPPLPFNAKVEIHVDVEQATGLALTGVVRWTSADGVGIQFGLMGVRETRVISELLATPPLPADD